MHFVNYPPELRFNYFSPVLLGWFFIASFSLLGYALLVIQFARIIILTLYFLPGQEKVRVKGSRLNEIKARTSNY